MHLHFGSILYAFILSLTFAFIFALQQSVFCSLRFCQFITLFFDGQTVHWIGAQFCVCMFLDAAGSAEIYRALVVPNWPK